MPNPVSILVWRDAKTDPPTGEMYRLVLVEFHSGETWSLTASEVEEYARSVWRDYPDQHVRRWAELPVVSDLTDEDVRNVASDSDYVADLWKRHGLPHAETRARADRLRAALGVRNNVAARLRAALAIRSRAALGGEKEET